MFSRYFQNTARTNTKPDNIVVENIKQTNVVQHALHTLIEKQNIEHQSQKNKLTHTFQKHLKI